MDRVRKMVEGARFVLLGAVIAVVFPSCHLPGKKSISLRGAVLEAASDPRRQTPLPDSEVSLRSEKTVVETKTDAAGSFRLTAPPDVRPEQAVTLEIQHAGYQPFEKTAPLQDQIYVVGLTSLRTAQMDAVTGSGMTISDLRVRYSVKMPATINVGSFARTFEVSGSGGVPCKDASRCSPDGRWKANVGSVSYDAGEGNEFREVRVSCIAGPCGFTSIEHGTESDSGRILKVSVLNWSDTTTFLAEAEVTRTQINDVVRYSIPVVFGKGMNFTLPASAEGPSVEADLNGSDIVFPLGPDLYLSWAACTLKVDTDRSKLYRCELKPGYRFR